MKVSKHGKITLNDIKWINYIYKNNTNNLNSVTHNIKQFFHIVLSVKAK